MSIWDQRGTRHVSCFVSRVVPGERGRKRVGVGACAEWAERAAGGKISNPPDPAGVKDTATHHLADEDHAEDEGA